MKRNLFYLLSVLSGFIYSQSPCVEEYFVTPTIPNSAGRVAAFPNHATPNLVTSPNNTNPDELYYPDLHPESQYVYNVIFKVVRNSNGERQTGDIGEAEVMNALRNMCVAFAPFKVYYKYKGIEYIDNNDLVGDRNLDDLLNDFITPYYNNHNFYIFVLDGNILSNSVDGEPLSSPGFGYIYSTATFVSTFGLNSARVLNHELGHNFNLRHDFRNYGAINCEHAGRYDQPGFNANFNGDWIIDTPATKIWDMSEYDQNGFYSGSDLDCNTDENVPLEFRYYKNYFPRINNFMHWHDGEDLEQGYFFTYGQGLRIRYTILTDIQNSYGIYELAQQDRSVLYQPFEKTNIPGDFIVSTTDNGDGTATVCRNLVTKHRFQKGYNLKFSNVPNITTSVDDLYEMIEATNTYDVTVNQIDLVNTYPVNISCTKGVICNVEPYIGGKVISTDFLGSTNMTIQELNQLEVNNPNLYNEMLNNYYHILKKQTESGAETQKVIYKTE